MADSIIDDVKMVNASFLNALDSDVPGEFEKMASESTTKFTRRMLREDAFSPAILPYEDIDNSMLVPSEQTEHPFILCEMEAAQAMPKSISFEDSAPLTPFFGDKYKLIFYTNTTPTWIKNVNLLRTYRADIRSLLTDNMLRDLSRLKDVKFMRDVDDICGIIPGAPSPITGLQQYIQLKGRLTRDNWVSSTNYLPSRSLLNGVFLCNQVTFTEFARWTRDQMGGDKAQELMLKGNSAWEKSEISGIPFIVTLKHDLVPNGVIYEFTKPNYLGRAGVLEKPKMYVKMDKDMLSMSCREVIGVTIANTPGVQKVEYTGVTGPTGGDGRIFAA